MEEAKILGDKNKLKEARDRLQLTIDEIDQSITGKTDASGKLKRDLTTAISKFKDRQTYKTDGDYYITQNFVCYQQERACNFEADYSTQLEFNTGFKSAMCDTFERQDSLDSVEAIDDYNFAPPLPQSNCKTTNRLQTPPFVFDQQNRATTPPFVFD